MPLNLIYKGFNLVADVSDSYEDSTYSDGATIAGSLSDMQSETGSNSVALTADWGIDAADNTVYSDDGQTAPDADITAVAAQAEADGFSVMFRPLIDFTYDASQATLTAPDGTQYYDGYWRAAYDPAPAGASAATYTADGTAFLQSYETMIVQEAKEAQAAHAAIFDIGTEIDQLTGPAFASEWNQIIAAVKAVYTGALTYSAISDDDMSPWTYQNGNLPAGTGNLATQVSFWSQMNYIGIDEYDAVDSNDPNFTDTPTTPQQEQTDLTDLIASWEQPPTDSFTNQVTGGLSLIQYFENLSATLDKPLLFTEIGYNSAPDAAAQPFFTSSNTYDPELQTLLYQAFIDAWQAQGNTSLQGVYLWDWEPDPATVGAGTDPSWTPQGNTGALQVLDAAFTSSPLAVVPETNFAGVAGYMGSPRLASGSVLDGDSDSIAGATLSVTAVQGGTVGSHFSTQYGGITLNSDGSYLYAPDATALAGATETGAPVSDVISFTVSDNDGNSTTSTLTISDYRDPTAVNESNSVVAGNTVTGSALTGDTDPDGVTLTAAAINTLGEIETNPIQGNYGTLTLNSDGTYSYSADSATALASDFTASKGQPLTDGFSILAYGGAGTFAPASLDISVSEPPLTNPITVFPETNVAAVAGAFGAALQATGTKNPDGTGLLSGDTDNEGLTLMVSGTPGGAPPSTFATQYGQISVGKLGAYTYTPNAAALAAAPDGAPVTDTIGYTVGDGTASEQTTLTITDWRDPVALNETNSVTAGQTVSVQAEGALQGALGGDSDPDGATLSVAAVNAQGQFETSPIQGTYGTLTLAGDGSYSYQADSTTSLAPDFDTDGNLPLTDTFNLAVLGPYGTSAASTLSISVDPTAAGTGWRIIDPMMTNNAGLLYYDQIVGGVMQYTEIGGLGPEWEFDGAGDLLGDGNASFLIRNNGTDEPGALFVGEIVNGAVQYTPIGGIGTEWQFEGNDDFLGDGQSQLLIRNTGTALPGALDLGQVVNGQMQFTPIGGLGLEWQFEGNGDFLGDGKQGFLFRNTGTADPGALFVGEVVNGAAQFTAVSGVGTEWNFEGVGDFFGTGESGFLLWNSGSDDPGALAIGEMVNGQMSFTDIGGVGPEWQFVGTGNYIDTNKDDFLLRNTNDGSLVVGSVSGSIDNATVNYTQVGGVGSEWNFHIGNPALIA